jgi:hypothetical protein
MTIGTQALRMNRTQMQGDNASVSQGEGNAALLLPAATNSPELEVKDAQLIFGAVWRDLRCGEFSRSTDWSGT